MKGHQEDICNEEQQVPTSLQICTCQIKVDTYDRYILISTCLVQNQMCSQQHGSQGSRVLAFSMASLRDAWWKVPWTHLCRCAPCRRTQTSRRLLLRIVRQQAGGVPHGNTQHPPWCSKISLHSLIWPHRRLWLEGQQVCLCALLLLPLVMWSHPERVRVGSFRAENCKFSCRVRARDFLILDCSLGFKAI